VRSSPKKRSTLKAERFAIDRLSPTFNPGLGSPALGTLKALADKSSSNNFAPSSAARQKLSTSRIVAQTLDPKAFLILTF